MARRFQGGSAEVDEEVREERWVALWFFLFMFVLVAAVSGFRSWMSGGSLRAYERDTEEMFVGFAVIWFGSSIHSEFRLRMKAIQGTVAEIEKGVTALNEGHRETLNRLDVLEDDLRSLNGELHPSWRTTRLPLPD